MIGGKILSGRTKDQNIGYIAEYLRALGIDLKEVRVVGDEERVIVDALNYTRAGLEVYFRPNEKAFKDDKAEHAWTKSFFGKSRRRLTEDELRHDSWKWENCQHAQHSYRGRSLNAPVFDIHYNARFEGRNDTRSQKLKYALVVSVTAKRVPDLYDRVVRRYRTQLEALRPVIEIPVRVETDENEGSP